MKPEILLELKRQSVINSVISVAIPKDYEKIFEGLKFSNQEKKMAFAVLKIELTARPFYARWAEFLVAFFSYCKSLLAVGELSNYTVGHFQIGIKTSLNWTNSKITPKNYLKRLMLLNTKEGGAKIFKLALQIFLKSFKKKREDLVKEFAEFYNGKGEFRDKTLTYRELLHILLFNADFYLKDVYKELHKNFRKSVNEFDDLINLRLKKIEEVVVEKNKLCAAVILCSSSKRKMIHSKVYGNTKNTFPVIHTRRIVASTLKIALYSAFLEKFPIQTDFEIYDSPMSILWMDNKIEPRNADNKFRGRVSLEYAFANSINIPAIQLIQRLGVENFILYLRKSGIQVPLPNTPLLALGPVKLTGAELLATLSPVLTSGHLSWARGEDSNIDLNIPVNNGERIISTNTADKIKHLLGATARVGTGKFLNRDNSEVLGGKTGTSENNCDFWFVGPVNNDVYGLVWIGNYDETPVRTSDGIEASSSRFAVPLWSDLLRFFADKL